MRIIKLAALNCLIFSILAGCNKEKVEGNTADQALIESAQEIVVDALKDPQSAQFRNTIGSESAKMVCGEVNSKNSMGGYVGFQPFKVSGEVDPVTHTFKANASTSFAPKETTREECERHSPGSRDWLMCTASAYTSSICRETVLISKSMGAYKAKKKQ